MQLRLTEVSGLEWGHLGGRAGDPELEAAQVLVVFTPSTHSLSNPYFLRTSSGGGLHPRGWLRFLGRGLPPPGAPNPCQESQELTGHRQQRGDVTGLRRRQDSERKKARRPSVWRPGLGSRNPGGSPCSDPQDPRSSLPPPAGRKGTRQDAREPLPGRPPRGGPRTPLQAHLPAPRSLQGQVVGGGACWVTCWRPGLRWHLSVSLPVRSLTPLPLGRRRGFPIAPGTQRSERTTAPTDQAGQLGPQLCRGLVGTAALPGLAAGTLGREQGKRLGRGRAASLRALGHKGLCLQPERRRSSARPSSPESAPWGPALRGPAQPAASQEADCRSCCVRPRSPGRGPRRRRTPRPLHPCGKGCRRCR